MQKLDLRGAPGTIVFEVATIFSRIHELDGLQSLEPVRWINIIHRPFRTARDNGTSLGYSVSALVENHPDLGMNIYVYFFSSNKGRDWPLAKLEEVAVVQSMFSCFAGDGWPFTRGTKAFEVQYKEGNPIINVSRDYENWLSSM